MSNVKIMILPIKS